MYSKKKVFLHILFVTFFTIFLYSLVCLFFEIQNQKIDKQIKLANPNGNIIRASYPNYKHMKEEYAIKIFEEWFAPKTEYKPFIGWRRSKFDGVAVNINELGIRNSENHQMNGSTWFFGGSTIWGTGADNKGTIPSHFAKITKKPVLNLGESGWNSFQELIYLQVLITSGYKPKSVVFYDGVNDAYHYCQKDNLPRLRHAYTTRWSDMSKRLRELEKQSSMEAIIGELFGKLKKFYYLQPIEYFTLSDKLKEAYKFRSKTGTPLNYFKPNKKYLFCDNQDISDAAAELTISAWLNAAIYLKSMDIPVWFVLQPTASYKPELYNLNYMMDFKKQQIVDEKASYENHYETLKSRFMARCGKLKICNSFIDLSGLFFGNIEPIFIDRYHISENGNKLIAQSLATVIINEE